MPSASVSQARSPGRHLTSSLQGAEVLIHINAAPQSRGRPQTGLPSLARPPCGFWSGTKGTGCSRRVTPAPARSAGPPDQWKPVRAASPRELLFL